MKRIHHSTELKSSSSKISNAINDDLIIDHEWLVRLVNDFYFTAESAEKIKNRLQTTFKNTYAYCKAYVLNSIQTKALHRFEESGLTKNHLCGRDEFNHMYHYLALEHLLNKNYTINEAIEEVTGLSEIQADGIRYDIPKEELLSLKTMSQVYIIERCYNIGIRAQHLKNLSKDFTFIHGDALRALLKRNNTTDIDTVIEQLNKLTFYQAAIIATHDSWIPTDLIGLSEYQTMCVEMIFKTGKKVNPADLLKREWSATKNDFSQIFVALVVHCEKSIAKAFELVDKLFADSTYENVMDKLSKSLQSTPT